MNHRDARIKPNVPGYFATAGAVIRFTPDSVDRRILTQAVECRQSKAMRFIASRAVGHSGIDMKKLISLNWRGVESAEKFLRAVEEGRVEIGAVVYRSMDGDINYHVIGKKHKAYIIGMLDILKTSLANEYKGFEE